MAYVIKASALNATYYWGNSVRWSNERPDAWEYETKAKAEKAF